jgi:hypothetical protein
MRFLRCLLVSALFLLKGLPLSADNLVTVTGDCGSRGALNQFFGFGTYWQLTTSYYNVNITIQTDTSDPTPSDGTPVLAFLTHGIGSGTTIASEVAHASFVIPPGSPPNTVVPVFTGLVLGPGNYFLSVIAQSHPQSIQGTAGGWCVPFSTTGTISTGNGVIKQWDYILNQGAPYPPSAGFNNWSSTPEFSVTGVMGTPTQTGTIIINSNVSNATFSLTPPVPGATSGGPYPVTLNSVPVRQYSVTFNEVQGYSTPSLPPQTLTAGGMISFDGQYTPVTQKCSNVKIDQSFSNSLMDVSFTGGCIGVLTIRNNKNYWTNFQISPTGIVSFSPVGGDTNLYAKYGLLPPSGLIGSGPPVQYNVSFSNPGDGISVFVDPTGQTVNGGAKLMNIVQITLNAVPIPGLSSAVLLVANNYEAVTQAFAQMPDLTGADQALFSSLNVSLALSELGSFFASPTEVSTFASMVAQIAISNGISVSTAGLTQALIQALKTLTGAPIRIMYAAILAVGNVFTLDFQYPQGSVQLTAQ